MAGIKETVDKVKSTFTLKADKVKSAFTLKKVAEAGKKLYDPDIPKPDEATIMPIPDASVAQTEARKRKARARTSGRDSTILTEGLGG
jgi:hypothetical protein